MKCPCSLPISQYNASVPSITLPSLRAEKSTINQCEEDEQSVESGWCSTPCFESDPLYVICMNFDFEQEQEYD